MNTDELRALIKEMREGMPDTTEGLEEYIESRGLPSVDTISSLATYWPSNPLTALVLGLQLGYEIRDRQLP